jgi:UDP-glucose 4-epimerase
LGKRAVILGAGGFIGSHLAVRLARTGWDVTAVVRDRTAPVTRLRLGRVWDQIEIIEGDASEGEVVGAILPGADVIFAMTGPPTSTEVPDNLGNALDNYVGPTMTLLQEMRRQDSSARAVFPGSRLQYGVTDKLPVPETRQLAPISWYGVCKTFEENLVRSYAHVHGIDTCWVRISLPYGPLQAASGRPFGIVGIFLDLAARGQPIPLYGGGQQVRDFVYAEDLTAVLESVATSDEARGEVFNVSGAEPVSLRDMAQTVVDVVGRGEIVAAPWPEDRRRLEVGSYWGDISKAHRDLGWAPQIGLREGIERTWQSQAHDPLAADAAQLSRRR